MSDEKHGEHMEAPGVFVLGLIFLATFMIAWFAHLKWLVEVWNVR